MHFQGGQPSLSMPEWLWQDSHMAPSHKCQKDTSSSVRALSFPRRRTFFFSRAKSWGCYTDFPQPALPNLSRDIV